MTADRRTWLRPCLPALGTLLLLSLPSLPAAAVDAADPPADAGWHDARQMIMVITPDWHADHGRLRRFVRHDGHWQAVSAAVPVMIGRGGAGWGLGLQPGQEGGPVKREGDNRSPAGVFGIGTTFGYAAHADTRMPYLATTASDYCVDVPHSPDYNRIVDARTVGAAAVRGATEPMRRDLAFNGDQRYRLGFFIKHNPQARPGAGSCIFGHLWKSPSTPTTGCTAMRPQVMARLLAWLDPRDHPVFVLLPQAAYQRLRARWKLPAMGAS